LSRITDIIIAMPLMIMSLALLAIVPSSFPRPLSDSPVDVTSPPLLGEHNEEVYVGELGLGHEELHLLRSSGVI